MPDPDSLHFSALDRPGNHVALDLNSCGKVTAITVSPNRLSRTDFEAKFYAVVALVQGMGVPVTQEHVSQDMGLDVPFNPPITLEQLRQGLERLTPRDRADVIGHDNAYSAVSQVAKGWKTLHADKPDSLVELSSPRSSRHY